MKDNLYQQAIEYHKYPTPGKIAIRPTTPMATQHDLALAYSPGVAAPCEEIEKDPLKALDYTSRGNLVAVISNGTAVLGLGAIGALASKPVMEGKSVLFKKFANVDSIDIEIDETDVDTLVETIARLEPTFGGINLEDIKAPECFEVERRLKERMKIPVFHDDQHGTAIIVGAAFTNWIEYSGRNIKDIKLVASGAGASAIACLNMLVQLGLPKENITVTDRNGVVYKGRNVGMDPIKEAFAIETKNRTLKDAIKGADVFLGLSGPGVIDKETIATMADAPLVMTLANPTPEIMPEETRQAKPDAIICTGRSDYPNQVNNVLCFPFIFRGALDVGATAINEEMKVACVKALAALTRKEVTPEVAAVYSEEDLQFGPNYLIPKPFDPRLITELPIAVAKAAMETGVATRPIKDFDEYEEKLQQLVFRTQQVMRPLFDKARTETKKIVYCEGEDPRVLQAVQTVLDEGLAKPILIGRRRVVESRIKKHHLRMKIDIDFELVDPENDPRYREYWSLYHEIMQRKGFTQDLSKMMVRTNTTVIGSLMVKRGEADSLICGTFGRYYIHREIIENVLGLKDGITAPSALMALNLPRGTFFMTDTHVNYDPTAEEIAQSAILAAERIKDFGINPKAALVSHSNFGAYNNPSATKMRKAYEIIKTNKPDLEIDGEMHADCALSEKIREMIMPNSTLSGVANLLIMPNLDSANIAYNMLKILGDGIAIGPMLMGITKPAHILTTAASARGILNTTAIAAVDSQKNHS